MVHIRRSALALSSLALAAHAQLQNLQALLESNDELSQFRALATAFPDALSAVTARPGTLLAPSNNAFDAFLQDMGPGTTVRDLNETTAADLLAYHYLDSPQRSAALSEQGGMLAPTSLLDSALANLNGTAQVVFASAYGSAGQATTAGGLQIFSGIGAPADVSTADIELDDGSVVHILSNVLNFPKPCSGTAEQAQLNTLTAALDKTKLWDVVDTTPKFTCFAPTDEAFQAAGVNIDAMSEQEIGDALKYHSLVGDVAYSTALEDGDELETMLGPKVTVSKRDGKLFLNDVEVLTANVIMTNGVAHVLNGVLTPPKANGGSGSADDDDDSDDAGSDSAAAALTPAFAPLAAFLASSLFML